MDKISLLVGLKNNLDYNKHFYKTTRELYPNVEICFVSYGSTDGTHEWLDSLQDNNIKYSYSDKQKTFSDTFNKATELATKEYVAYLHNDIVLAPGFLENIEKHLNKNNVVSYTTIEPPIFSGHERPGKILKDLGTDLESFNKNELYSYVKEQQSIYQNKTEPGITFFMCLSRELLLDIGGMDNRFNPMFCEDDDLILRLKIKGLNLFTSLDAMCYHFVSKTSRFSEEFQTKTQQIEVSSNIIFIKKWGFRTSKYNKVYKKAYIIIGNATPDLTKALDLLFTSSLEEANVVVEIDINTFTQQDYAFLTQLNDIIAENNEVGMFELGNVKVNVESLESFEQDLIFIRK